MRERTTPRKITEQPAALPGPSEVSAILREFAEPLLYADPAGPADVETIRTSMMLAMICWNLPVYESTGSPLYAQGLRTLDAVVQRVPKGVATRIRKLIDDRKAKFRAMPFLVWVDVQGTTLENATIVAEARLPGRSAS